MFDPQEILDPDDRFLEPIGTGTGPKAGLVRLHSTRPVWLTGGAVLCALITWAILTMRDTRERALESAQVAPVQRSEQFPQLANPNPSSPFLASQPRQTRVGATGQATLEREQATSSTSGDESSQPGEVELSTSTSVQADKLEPINPAAGAHAIVPEPALSEALAAEEKASPPSTSQRERVRVASAANIHSGPSASDALLGTAQVGAEAEVASRDADWVEIIDPASEKSGWIHSEHLLPAPAVG
jgi:Bacterial SH3 domain